MNIRNVVLALGVSMLSAIPLHAQQPQTPPPDNSKVNKQGGMTADKQSQTKADLALVKSIRQAVVKDKTLSLSAHNCKIITNGGHVLLRGPVDSQSEKDAVAAIAVKFAGDGHVTNELTVKTAK